VGCSRQPEYKIIYKTKVIVEKPPKTLLYKKIDVPRPPNKFTYVNSGPFDRERMLTEYIIKLLSTIKNYKIKNKALIEWYNKTIKNYTTSGNSH
jgi:hypothetical protein